MGSIASAVIGGIVLVRDTFTLCYSFAKEYKKKRDGIDEKAGTLICRIEDVERRRTEAMDRDEIISSEVHNWLNRSKNLLDEKDSRPSSGFFSKCCWRCNAIEQVDKLASQFDAILAEGRFDRVSDPRPPPPVEPTRITEDDNFEMFSSVRTALDKIMAALKEGGGVRVVGVHGIPGVGKTTLVKKAAANAVEEKLFDRVVFSTVSGSPDLEKIQKDVAECLGITLAADHSSARRAGVIESKLVREKKVLIVLDDVWEELDLKKVGIPCKSDLENSGSKLVFTTRNEHVCFVMRSQEKIGLDIWSDQESREFLKKMARTDFKVSRGFEKIAESVADECKGLPLALNVVAKALGDKPMEEWERALERLRDSENPHPDSGTTVFRCIKLSYDYLKSEARMCFLLCCLFPEDHNIDREELARYAFGLGLFRNANTVDKARGETGTVAEKLKQSGLLLPGDRDRNRTRVKMHDVIRDVAIQIASSGSEEEAIGEERPVFVVQTRKYDRPVDWPSGHTAKTCTAVSVMSSGLRKLPDNLDCPKLGTLLLQDNNHLSEIASTFFGKIVALRVLNMSGTGASSLPPSIEDLKMLRALHIDKCKFSDISRLGVLENLAILSYRQSAEILVLPEDLGELRKLRLLDLTSCRGIKRLPPNVLSSLSSLEELYMKASFAQWDDGTNPETSQNASFFEVLTLDRLTILEVDIADAKSLQDFGVKHVPKWSKFSICICGDDRTRPLNMQPSTVSTKNLLLDTSIKDLPNWFIEAVSKKTERVTYADAKKLNMFEEQANGRLASLKSLMLDKYTWVYYLTWDISDSKPVFESLEELQIYDSSITTICDGDLPAGSFENLESLMVQCCHEMGTTVLSRNFIERVNNLNTLHVNNANAKEVFALHDDPNQTQRYLGKLREMRLENLYELETVWKGPARFADFGNLKLIYVINCVKLRNIFSVTILNGLLKLEDLWVEDCDKMVGIVGDRDDEISTLRLPNLKTLCLSNLPKLTNFWSPCAANLECPVLECPVLEYTHVRKCPDFLTPDFNSSKEIHQNDDQHMETLKKRLQS